jgi:hypothetical protein
VRCVPGFARLAGAEQTGHDRHRDGCSNQHPVDHASQRKAPNEKLDMFDLRSYIWIFVPEQGDGRFLTSCIWLPENRPVSLARSVRRA